MESHPEEGDSFFAVVVAGRANICATELQQEEMLFKLQMKRAPVWAEGPRLELLNLSG